MQEDDSLNTTTHSPDRAATRLIILAFIVLLCVLAIAAALVQDLSRRIDAVQTVGVAPADADGPIVRAWSRGVSPALIHEMAGAPGRTGEFFALNSGKIQRFDAAGARLDEFDAPSKSSRIASDPTGAVPHLLIVYATGERLRAILALRQQHGPDLLVSATHRGLTAWRPVLGEIERRR